MTTKMNLRKSVGTAVLMVVLGALVACGHNETGVANTKGKSKTNGINRLPIDTTGFRNIDSPSFKKAYPNAGDEFIYDVVESEDGFLLVGSAPSPEDSIRQPFAVKISRTGERQWAQLVPVAADSEALAACKTSDGYMVVGRMLNNETANYDAFAVRLLADGSAVMAFTYGSEGDDEANAVIREQNGSYLIVGSKAEDILVLKINNAGEVLFDRTYGTPDASEQGFAAKQTREGGLLIGGAMTYAGAKPDALVLKLDAQLNVDASMAFANQDPERRDVITGVEEAFDGSYVVCGASTYFQVIPLDPKKKRINSDETVLKLNLRELRIRVNGNTYSFAMKLDSTLNVTEQVCYKYGDVDRMGMTPRPNWYLSPTAIRRSSGGGYVMALNYGMSFNGIVSNLSLVAKLTTELLPAQATQFDGEGTEFISTVKETSDFGLIAAGYTTSASIGTEDIQHDAMAIKISRSGEIRDDGSSPISHQEAQIQTLDNNPLLQIETAIQ